MTAKKIEIPNFLTVQKDFIEAIVQEIFSKKDDQKTKILCFKFRFNPQNFDLKHKSDNSNEKTIASLISEQLNGGFSRDGSNGINQYIKELCTIVKNNYQTEIVEFSNNQSDINHDNWRWKEVYNWLWKDKFPRWFWSNKLIKLTEPNKKNLDWIIFITRVDIQRGIDGKSRNSPTILPLNVQGHFCITINYFNYYLLLLNLGADKKNINLICPSKAFEPSYFVNGEAKLIPSPQGNSDYKTIYFNQKGEEELIAIVLKEPPNFSWLDSNQGDNIPILEHKQIEDLWNFLITHHDWEIFYKSFTVV